MQVGFSNMKQAFFATLASVIVWLIPAVAQTLPDDPEGKLISSIDVQFRSGATVNRDLILSNMSLRQGQRYTREATQRDIKNLIERKIVDLVDIQPEISGSGVRVTVIASASGVVSEVQFAGNQRLETSELRKEVPITVGEPMDEVKVLEGKTNVEELYRDRGFSDVTVDSRFVPGDQPGFTKVVYQITEGTANKLRKIHFRGLNEVSEKELRKLMRTKPRGIISRIAGSAKVDNLLLEEDKKNVERALQNKGYMDARVTGHALGRVSAESDFVDLFIDIRQGMKYSVGDVRLRGNSTFDNAVLASSIKLQPGHDYSAQKIAEDAQRLQDYYGSRGYADANVSPQITSLGGQRVGVVYNLSEGRKSYIRKINISGMEYTKDSVVRHELSVNPGDEFNTVRLRESKSRLENTRFFSEVDISPEDTGDPNYKDLNVNVSEGKSGSFQVGAAFTSIENLFGYVEYREANFDIANWRRFPPRGAGQKFEFRAQWGTRTKDFVIGLTEPWFMGQRLQLGGELFYREMLYLSDEYSQRNVGGAMWLRRPVRDDSWIQLEYRLQNVSIYDLDNDKLIDRDGDGLEETFIRGSSPEIAAEEGDFLESKLTMQFVQDTRDDNRLPRTGHRLSLEGNVSGGFLGGDVDTYHLGLAFTQHALFPWDTILTFHTEINVVDSWGSSNRVPIFNREFLGGAYNLRGFRYRDVGPVDGDGEPLGGNTSAFASLEYSVPIVEKLRVSTFTDIGFVNSGSWDFSSSEFNADIGLGVRIESPFGPLRLDYALPFERSEHQGRSGRFNFNLGYRF